MPTLSNPLNSDNKTLTSGLAGPALRVVREMFGSPLPDDVRLAVLVEIAGAAATLARAITLGLPVDLDAVAGQVTDPTDIAPVLGRGTWSPTAWRYVPLPPRGVKHPRASRQPIADTQQLDLFADAAGSRGDR